MLLRIVPRSGEPLFAQVANAVRAEIAAGGLGARDRLPAAREVAESLDINIHTVLRAYQELRDEGLIELRRGRGAVVTEAAGAIAGLRPAIDDLVRLASERGIAPAMLASAIREAAHAR